MILRKAPAEVEIMARAGAVVAAVHEVLREALRPGLTTADLDTLAEHEVRSRGAVPSFKGYRGFPATLCTSVNDEVVHGIPDEDVTLRTGDLIKIDLGVVVDGYHADSAVTWVVGGQAPDEVQALIETTRAALWAGLAAATEGNRVGDVSAAVERVGSSAGLGVVRDYTGHGIGRALHEDPHVPNVGRPGKGPRLEHGLVIAIEPMFTLGSPENVTLDDDWTVVTADGSLSAHWEHTVAVTPEGPRVLTARSDEPAFAVPQGRPVDAVEVP